MKYIDREIDEMIFILTNLAELVDEYKDINSEIKKKMYTGIRRKREELRSFFIAWKTNLEN
jgi:hypothetical protein